MCRLRRKGDDEDSDAEDEEAPLTHAEMAAEEDAAKEHKIACKKVTEGHQKKLQQRAGLMMHTAALAAWARIYGGEVAT